MTSGYTSPVAEKDISFREYALGCARAFGYLTQMRGEPSEARVPNKFTPNKIHLKQLAKAGKILQTIEAMTDEQVASEVERLYDQSLEQYARILRSTADITERYVKMRAKAKKWEAPTPNHKDLRDFMISQLEQAIAFDCSINCELPKKMTPQKYRAMLLEKAQEGIHRYAKKYSEEVAKAQEATIWVRQLRKSLPKK